MRYPIILLAVLALAVAAGTAQADCPDFDTLYAEDCGDLPVYGREIDHGGCTAVDWYFRFTRTSDTTGHCRVRVTINSTDCDTISIDSDDYTPGTIDTLSGTCYIIGTPIQGKMEHPPAPNSNHLFSDLELWYKTYEP